MTIKTWMAVSTFGILSAAGLGHAAPDEDESTDDSAEAASDDAALGHPTEMAPDDVAASTGYKSGFFIHDGPNKLAIHGRVQARSIFHSTDEGSANRGSSLAFLIPRARLALNGSAYSKRLTYYFQAAFDKGTAALKDFYVDHRIGEGELRVRVGQFKKPFSRQRISSSGKLEFVDRTIVDSYMNNGHDIGFELHNGFENSPEIEWALGIFNGTEVQAVLDGIVVDPMTGQVSGGQFSNVPNKIRPAVVARVGYNHNGIKGYSEADLEGGEFRFAVAAATMTHLSRAGSTATERAGVDYAVKLDGFSSTGGLYATMAGEDVGGLKYVGIGTYAQLGYVLEQAYQPSVRFALISLKGGDKQQEATGAFSWYSFRHGFKVQTDLSLLASDVVGTKTTDYRGRVQMQLSF